mmetsp:Transcript_17262/g.50072  ORF Transcript_17262/g.50072 Transcript_17262/m.50072 type:complete len:228 (+) Transcript_17262:219-902(+)
MTLYIRWFALATLVAGSLSASVPDQAGTGATDRNLMSAATSSPEKDFNPTALPAETERGPLFAPLGHFANYMCGCTDTAESLARGHTCAKAMSLVPSGQPCTLNAGNCIWGNLCTAKGYTECSQGNSNDGDPCYVSEDCRSGHCYHGCSGPAKGRCKYSWDDYGNNKKVWCVGSCGTSSPSPPPPKGCDQCTAGCVPPQCEPLCFKTGDPNLCYAAGCTNNTTPCPA